MAIVRPQLGLLVFQTDGSPGLYYFNGVSWLNMATGRVPDAAGTTPPQVSTLAGLPSVAGTANGAGAAGRFNSPDGVAVDAAGTLFVADLFNDVIRQITPVGVVATQARIEEMEKQLKALYGARDPYLETFTKLSRDSRDILLGKHSANPAALGDYGFDVIAAAAPDPTARKTVKI